MLSVMAAWLYIGIQCLIFGCTIEYGISFFLGKDKVTSAENRWEILKKDGFSLSRSLFCGITFLSVYGTVFSFFDGLGLGQILLQTALGVGCLVFLGCVGERKRWGDKKWSRWVLIFLGFVVFAYFTSRGYEHYDTMLYHAQAIHYLEEYGTVIGLGNTYFRLAYNSACFVLTAMYSFSFLGGQSLHCISGLFVWFLWIGIVENWELSVKKKWQTSDLIRMGAIYYICMILTEIVSPASDYPTMILVFYLFLEYFLALEHGESVVSLGKICVLACFAVTLKTSAAPVVLLTLYPAVLLLQKKEGKKIATFIGLGLVVVLPYLVRGYLLSGYVLYPSTFLQSLAPDWQMKVEVLKMDAAEITAWGKGIEYESDWSMSFAQWFPIWMSRQKTGLEKLLVLASMGASVPLGMVAIWNMGLKKLFGGRKPEMGTAVAMITIIVSFYFWLFMAPLPRYGWCYLFLVPILFGGFLLEKMQGLSFLSVGCLVVLCGLLLWKGLAVGKMFWNSRELPYYLQQQDYSRIAMTEVAKETTNGESVTFYVPETGFYGYYDFPAVKNTEDFAFRGEGISQGFQAR